LPLSHLALARFHQRDVEISSTHLAELITTVISTTDSTSGWRAMMR